MGVEDRRRAIDRRSVRDDDGMTGRGAGGGHEALGGEVGDKPVGGALAVTGIGGIGRDRLDGDERGEPFERRLQVGVGMSEGGVELLRRKGHYASVVVLSLGLAPHARAGKPRWATCGTALFTA